MQRKLIFKYAVIFRSLFHLYPLCISFYFLFLFFTFLFTYGLKFKLPAEFQGRARRCEIYGGKSCAVSKIQMFVRETSLAGKTHVVIYS